MKGVLNFFYPTFEEKIKEKDFKKTAENFQRKSILIILIISIFFFIRAMVIFFENQKNLELQMVRIALMICTIVTSTYIYFFQKFKLYNWTFIILAILMNFIVIFIGYENGEVNEYQVSSINSILTISIISAKSNWFFTYLFYLAFKIIFVIKHPKNFNAYTIVGILILVFLILANLEHQERKIFSEKYDKDLNFKQFKEILKRHVKSPISLFDKSKDEFSFRNVPFKDIQTGQLKSKVKLESYIRESVITIINCNENESKEEEIIFIKDDNSKDELYFKVYYEKFTWKYSKCTYLFIFSDITHERMHALSLEQNNKFKDLLIASVSHDIRTPLNASINFLEFALKINKDNQVEFYLNRTGEANKLLLAMVNDLLDFNLISNDHFNLIIERTDMNILLNKVYNLFENQITLKGLTFIIDNELGDISFNTDSNRLERVLMNLVSNAIKFTTSGFIKIQVQLVNLNQMLFSVQDTGIGIKEEDMERLFNLYGTIEHSGPNLNSHGIGLGLTISNDIVCLINNSREMGIQVTSEYGVGTTFKFIHSTLEASPSHSYSQNQLVSFRDSVNEDSILLPEIDEEEKHSGSNDHLRNFKKLQKRFAFLSNHFEYSDIECLIIEDEITNMSVLNHLIELNEMQCETTYNGKEALEKVKSYFDRGKCFKLIITDINMPIMNGYIFIKEYKKLELDYNLPKKTILIACTANSTNNKKSIKKEYEVDDVVEKPINMDKIRDLKLKIKNLI